MSSGFPATPDATAPPATLAAANVAPDARPVAATQATPESPTLTPVQQSAPVRRFDPKLDDAGPPISNCCYGLAPLRFARNWPPPELGANEIAAAR